MKNKNAKPGSVWLAIAGISLLGSLAHAKGGDFEVPLSTNPIAEASDWKFNIELNLWGPDLTATTALGPKVDLGVDDIFSDLKMAFMASVAARKGRWFAGVDMVYMDLGQSMLETQGTTTLDSDVDLAGWILTPAIGYTVCEGDWGKFDFFGGARYLYLDVDASLTESDPAFGTRSAATSESGSDWAGVIGFKGHYNMTPKWFVPYYFDIGTGEPDLTLQAFLGVGYRAKYFDVSLGYRYLKWDLQSGSPLSELEAKGPMLGINFSF